MTLGIYPVFETELTGTQFESLGESLAANFERLDEIALSNSLTPLTAFADNRPIPDDFDGDPDELAEVMGECTDWFDPAVGQSAIQRLANHIKSDPNASRQFDEADVVVAELEEMSRVLGEAAAHGLRFRLEMS